MADLMASFGDGYVETKVISESNSIKYRLTVVGSNSSSQPNTPFIQLNGRSLSALSHGQGINVWDLNLTNLKNITVASRKTFDLSTSDSNSNNVAFLMYLAEADAQGKTYLITSSGVLRSSPSVDKSLAARGSVNWPQSDILNRFNASYAGIYSGRHGKIVSENRIYTDGTAFDSRAKIEIVFDTANDIGATGFPYRVVFDPNEYKTTANALDEIQRYPNSNSINLLKDFLMKPGEFYNVSFELFGAAGLFVDKDPSGKPLNSVQFDIRFYKGQEKKSTENFSYPYRWAGQWYKFDRTIQIPLDVDGFSVIAFKSGLASTEQAGVRNVTICQSSRGDTAIVSPATISVNGVRNNKIIDGTTNLLLKLPNTDEDPTGNIYSADFREQY